MLYCKPLVNRLRNILELNNMIEDRIIDNKISLKNLLALAVCIGVKAGRGEIDYHARGAWHLAQDMLDETEEILSHRARVLASRTAFVEIAEILNRLEVV